MMISPFALALTALRNLPPGGIAPPPSDHITLENGDDLLLEDGSLILTEAQ